MAGNGSWAEFKGDLRASVRAWRVAPLLPVISVGLLSMHLLPNALSWLSLPALLFHIGWVGTERMWYLRIYRGQPISAGELLRFTRGFFWRFLRLGLLACVVSLPIPWLAFMVVFFMEIGDRSQEVISLQPIFVSMTIMGFLIGIALTFVTPALAFSTNRVREALGLGLRMLREHWPLSAGYALMPPLALVLMPRVPGPLSPTLITQTSVMVAAILLNLWFKGATAAFYLRRVEVGINGAFMDYEQAESLTLEQARD